jgi:acyl-CoA synthetase (AMP-forming)/AMP-acid ligase II
VVDVTEMTKLADSLSVFAGAPDSARSFVSGAGRAPLSTKSVGEMLVHWATFAGEQPALMWAGVGEPHQLSWSQLADVARRSAAELLEVNPQRRRVALVAFNSVDWIVAMFACALSGMPVVPISPSVTDDEARHQLALAEVGLILSVASAGGRDVLSGMRSVAGSVDLAPPVLDMSCIGDGRYPATDLTPVGSEDEFLVQFTSGTTGLPKAASLSHRAALNCGAFFALACDARQGDRWLNPLPLNHVGGSVTGVIATLAVGAAYIVVERFTTKVIIDSIRQIQPAMVGLVPTMVIDLLTKQDMMPDDFASVRTVVAGATAVDPSLIDEMESRLGITFMVSYGQSESAAMTSSRPSDSVQVRTRTLGRCLAGRDFVVRNGDGAAVPLGTIGELCVRGPLLMSGYLQPGGGLDNATDDEGWHQTGDLCSMDTDGVLTFHGRIREVIIRGGENIYPAEIEHKFSALETVSEVAVFGAKDARLGERVIAAVVPAAGAAVDTTHLAFLAATQLSAYKRPAEWYVAATLPRTSTGKVRKHLLREWYENGLLHANCGITDQPS